MFHTLPEPVSAMHATTLPASAQARKSSGVLGPLSRQADSDAVLAARSGVRYLRGFGYDPRLPSSRQPESPYRLNHGPAGIQSGNRPGNGCLNHSCIHKSIAGALRTIREGTCGRESVGLAWVHSCRLNARAVLEFPYSSRYSLLYTFRSCTLYTSLH